METPSEHYEQRTFVQWFRQTFRPVRIFAVANGGDRSLSQGARLKAEGVTRGVPDLYIPAWLLWIEMKRQKGGKVDPDQADWHIYLREIGHTVLICRGCEDAIKQVNAFRQKID
jgi:hypothetical protein